MVDMAGAEAIDLSQPRFPRGAAAEFKVRGPACEGHIQVALVCDHFPRAQELVLGRVSDAKARRSVAARLRLR